MKKLTVAVVAATLCLSLSGCATMQAHKQETGLIVGGVAGGIIGNSLTGGSVLGTGAGAVGGAYLGSEIGKRMK